MKIVRYQNSPLFNPSTSYSTLRNEMDRLFDVAFPALSTLQRGLLGGLVSEFPIDLFQEKDAFVVRAELSGFTKDEINVEVADGILTISGYQKTGETKSSKKEAANAVTEERRVSRSVTLPEHLKLDQIQATYENGVLTVKLPKSEEVKPKQIAITVK